MERTDDMTVSHLTTSHLTVSQWIARQIPNGASVLELMAGDGDRAFETMAMASKAGEWILTDISATQLAKCSQKYTELQRSNPVKFYRYSVESPWERIKGQARLAIARNGLHVLSCLQIQGLFSQAFQNKMELLVINAFNLEHIETYNFQVKTLKDAGQIWPESFIHKIAANSGMSLCDRLAFTSDESCYTYGPVTALRFTPVNGPNPHHH